MPNLRRLSVRDFAQIQRADIALGELTILVGPQATGKSLFLQLLKLALDGPRILGTLKYHGFDWNGQREELLSLYFGEGMASAWSARTAVQCNGTPLPLPQRARLHRSGPGHKEHRVFYIPAHRTLAIAEGWPRGFRAYSADTPFVVRHFSDELYVLLGKAVGGNGDALFPQERRLKEAVRNRIAEVVFHGATLRLRTARGRREFVLQYGAQSLPYMEWSAGQREFIPLLLGLYHLLPPGKLRKRDDIDWVVIEEPEMGLHPKGTVAVFLAILDLLARGYRVALSTHAPVAVDVAWALHELRGKPHAQQLLCAAMDAHSTPDVLRMAGKALRTEVRVYLFDYGSDGRVVAKDISALDPGDADLDVAGWGGLTGQAGRISDAVSKAAAGPEP